MGKTTKSESKQTNEPPAWAKPSLERAGQDALALYESGKGYNTYTGPTMAPMSDVTLGGMNSLLSATGYKGAPVTNNTVNSMVPDVNALMAQVMKNKPKTSVPQVTQQQTAQPKYRLIETDPERGTQELVEVDPKTGAPKRMIRTGQGLW